MRERWASAVRSRLDGSGGPYGLLDDAALTEAVELFACTTDARDILESCHLVGLLHWKRGRALADERALPEIRTGVALLVVVQRSGAELPLPDTFPRSEELTPAPVGEAVWEDVLMGLGLRLEDGADAHTARLAVCTGRNAVADTHADPARLADRLRVLGMGLSRLFDHTGHVPTLEEAIQVARQAVAAAREAGTDPSMCLHNLAEGLRDLFKRTNDARSLHEAVDIGRQLIRNPPGGEREREVIWAGLSDYLRILYQRTNDPAFLDEALQMNATSVECASSSGSGRTRAEPLMNAALLRRAEFERTGDQAVLHEGITMARGAVGAAPRGTALHHTCLYNLGSMLHVLSGHAGDLAALDEAIVCVRAVIRATPADHPDGPLYRATLAGQLHDRYFQAGNAALLDEAITLASEAVEATPQNHPDRWMYLSNLAVPLKAKAELTEDLDILRRVISIQRQAAVSAAQAGRDQVAALSNLNNSLRLYFHWTRELPALEEAISVGRAAVGVATTDHHFRSQCEFNLATALSSYGLAVHDDSLVEEALGLLETAATRNSAPTRLRVSAAREWAETAVAVGRSEEAARAFAFGVGLLPRLAARGLERADATRWMAEHARLASDAAACALAIGRPDDAVELLEAGRGVLLAQALESRSDLTELREHDQKLADRFHYLCVRLDGDTSTDGTADTALDASQGENAPDTRRTLAQELDALVTRVRALPGLERFLLPQPVDRLTAEAHTGPLVMINVSRYRCDALILTGSGVQVCELPEVDHDDVHDRLGDMHHMLDRIGTSPAARREAENVMVHDTLPWLWDAVAGPVLEQLGLTSPVDGHRTRRLWWIPCGPLAFFPLHAAGHHLERPAIGPRRTVMDRVVSSYTPTVRALSHARAQRARQTASSPSGPRPPRVLAVAMPYTPDASELEGAQREYEHLEQRFPEFEGLVGEDATREAVLSRLATHPWAHFACHAGADPTDPSRSHLLVYDHADRPLSVLEVSRLRLDSSAFAYLSACSTAVTTPRLADEALHVVTAFQLAGFPHVVGTLWEINDTMAATIAEHIYTHLGAVGYDPAHTSACVHRATRLMRDRFPSFPTLWSAHIHMGA